MMLYCFNTRPLREGRTIPQPSMDVVKNTMSLHRASLEVAAKYGGELTRAALGALELHGNRKYVTVDTKVHMLMPGFMPAIPGWHTDGGPRDGRSPDGKGGVNLKTQGEMENEGDVPYFHLLVTGAGCLTRFLEESLVLDLDGEPDVAVYEKISGVVEARRLRSKRVESCRMTEFGWWDIHTGVRAEEHEWRFLIRVTESNWVPPKRDLDQIIRTQNTVYVPSKFGW